MGATLAGILTSTITSPRTRRYVGPSLPQDRAYAVLLLLRKVDAGPGYISDELLSLDVAANDALWLGLISHGTGWSSVEGLLGITARGRRMVLLNYSALGLQEVRFPPTLWDRISRIIGC